jgi:putative cell wall-binding protein
VSRVGGRHRFPRGPVTSSSRGRCSRRRALAVVALATIALSVGIAAVGRARRAGAAGDPVSAAAMQRAVSATAARIVKPRPMTARSDHTPSVSRAPGPWGRLRRAAIPGHRPLERPGAGRVGPTRSFGVETSNNWAGLAYTGTTFTGVSATWIVPTVQPSSVDEYSGTWIGIDGLLNGDLIQGGTGQDSGPDGGYYAWYEILPNLPTALGPVSPGDTMQVVIQEISVGTWSISVTDSTSGETSGPIQVQYQAPNTSVEWIEEAPTDSATGAILPLANFGTVHFTNLAAVAAVPSLAAPTSIVMEDIAGDILAYPTNSAQQAFDIVFGSPGTGSTTTTTASSTTSSTTGASTTTSTNSSTTTTSSAGSTTTTSSASTTTSTIPSTTTTGSSTTTTTTAAPTTTTSPPAAPAPVTRLFGASRIDTSIAVSVNSYPPGGPRARAAVLAVDDAFPDALAGTPLAVAKGGPLLLTGADSLDPGVGTELTRILPPGATVYLLGGTSALGANVASAVEALGFRVVRYGGATRFATATVIAEQGLDDPSVVLEVTGLNFPDALAAGAAASEAKAAVLLTDGASQSAVTATYLSQHPGDTRYAIGGPATTADPSATAVFGDNRYQTSAVVAAFFFPSPKAIGIATGLDFPDALSGGAHIGRLGGPLLLTSSDSPSTPTEQYLEDTGSAVASAYIYGGALAVSNTVQAAFTTALAGAGSS